MKFKNTLLVCAVSLLQVSATFTMLITTISRKHQNIYNGISQKHCSIIINDELCQIINSEKITGMPTRQLNNIVVAIDTIYCIKFPKSCHHLHCGKNLYSSEENLLKEKTTKKNRDKFLKYLCKGYFELYDMKRIFEKELSLLDNIEKETLKRMRNPGDLSFVNELNFNIIQKRNCIKNKLQAICDTEKKSVQE